MPDLPSQPKPTRNSPKGERTRDKILDAAEKLFAAQPYGDVHQREIADQAGMLVGLVTHHYPNKIDLYDAVARRRADELNALRLQRLSAVKRPEVGAILDAFFLPMIALAQGCQDWTIHARFVSSLLYSDLGVEVHNRNYVDSVRHFLEALGKALPDMDKQVLAQAFLYSIDIVLISLFQPGRFEQIIELTAVDATHNQNFESQYETMRSFLLGGFAALAR